LIHGHYILITSFHLYILIYIDTTLFPIPFRNLQMQFSNGIESLTIGFVDTIKSSKIPIDTFYVNGTTGFASIDFSRQTATDTVWDTNMVDGYFTVTASDSINKKISGSFNATLIDDTGDTIRTYGNFSNFGYTVQWHL
jgi:hypothetical protein